MAKSAGTTEVVRGTGQMKGSAQTEVGTAKSAETTEVARGTGQIRGRCQIEVGTGTAEIFLGKQARRSQTRRV